MYSRSWETPIQSLISFLSQKGPTLRLQLFAWLAADFRHLAGILNRASWTSVSPFLLLLLLQKKYTSKVSHTICAHCFSVPLTNITNCTTHNCFKTKDNSVLKLCFQCFVGKLVLNIKSINQYTTKHDAHVHTHTQAHYMDMYIRIQKRARRRKCVCFALLLKWRPCSLSFVEVSKHPIK